MCTHTHNQFVFCPLSSITVTQYSAPAGVNTLAPALVPAPVMHFLVRRETQFAPLVQKEAYLGLK